MATQASPQVSQALQAVSQKYNVPLWHLYAVAARESSLNPNAYNDYDWASGGPFPGRGLFQVTGQHMGNPQFAAYANASNDLGFNRFGQWVDPSKVPYMSNIYDPYQNAERYVAGYAVPWYHHLKSLHPDWSEDQLWDAVAFNWNKGIFQEYNPRETGYMAPYRDYAREYSKILGGGYFGDPVSATTGEGAYGPPLPRKPVFTRGQMGDLTQSSIMGPGASRGGLAPMAPGGFTRGAMTGFSLMPQRGAIRGNLPSGQSMGSSMGVARRDTSSFLDDLLEAFGLGATRRRSSGSQWLDYYNSLFDRGQM